MSKITSLIKNDVLYENPVFVQMLGLCPALAITTSIPNGLGMGIAATFVLACSNFIISVLRNFIPSKIRIPSYMIIISGFVTIVDLVLNAFFYDTLAATLGIFVPLIVVNCIILSRAEAFASKNKPLPSLIDGIFTGVGFTFALVVLSAVREILGNGTILGHDVTFGVFSPAQIISMPCGGFLVLGFVSALFKFIRESRGGDSK